LERNLKERNNTLTVSAHALRVASLPGSPVRTTNSVVGTVTLDAKASVLAASGGETPSLAVLVDRVDNPVDARVVADDYVLRIHQNNFVILVGSVLVDPVRVQHTKVGSVSTSALLRDTSQVSDEF
jgi:hypothetical protein